MGRVGQEMSKNINQQPPFQHYRHYFIAAAVATAIAGIVHLYIPFGFPVVFGNLAIAIFFLGSGIAQIFWILPMLKRWGKVLYRNYRKSRSHNPVRNNAVTWLSCNWERWKC